VTAKTDRVALVTGAARGQGAAIVARLQADGFLVAACDRQFDELQSSTAQYGDDVAAIDLDVTSAEQWEKAVSTAVDRFGGLSALVNNAGVLHRAALSDETPESFEGSWRVNCLGPFLGVRAALQHLRTADGASIVNTLSTSAIRPFPNHAAYGSSKWALRGLTVRDHIRAQVVPLGGRRTEPARELLAHPRRDHGIECSRPRNGRSDQ
jgi:NAD(P)-dependent dehydrogenase (short-subunit alcohol dehydrogenase family)